MEAKFYYKTLDRPIFILEAHTTKDDDELIEVTIKPQTANLIPSSRLVQFMPVGGQQKNEVRVRDFKIMVDDELVVPEEATYVYFYRDKVELRDEIIAEP